MPFDIGDTVQLQFKTPYMTVESVESGYVNCVWFDKLGNLLRGRFNEKILYRIK
jgi:uncharacterized protein YodC (DUF2158 family)